MKKLILLLGFVIVLLAYVTPQVSASDRDVGYAFVLPVDHNAVVSTACQAVTSSPEYVSPIWVRDTGSRLIELRAQSPGLRAENNYNIFAPPLSGCFYDMFYKYQSHSFTRLIDITSCSNGNVRIVSTSNGGAGY